MDGARASEGRQPGARRGAFLIGTAHIRAEEVARAAADPAVEVVLSAEALELVGLSRDVVQAAIDSGHKVYGLNTLLGSGRDTAVEEESILDYQIQVIRYHHSGVGALLAPDEVRAVILARLIGFTRGGSGVRPDTARFYAELLNRGVVPAIPRDGSVGSSDLTQLAAVAAVAIGEGQVLAADGTLVAGAEALARAGLEPLVLAPGEALAVVSANAYSIGAGALELGRLLQLADLADTALALSLEATARYDGGGNLSPFSPAVQAAKAVDGQRVSAAKVRHLLRGGWLEDPRRDVSVQDALSFRAAPQTHGAFRAQVTALADALEVELNGRGDNPLTDLASGRMVSGGNFQPMQLALAFEALRLGLAHVGISSERRIAKLYPPQRLIRQLNLEAARSGTPLASEDLPGLLWYSAAGLLAELKFLAAPATLGAPTLSADVEDHSTLAPLALQQLERAVEAADKLLTIEALTAAYLLAEAQGAEAGRSVPAAEVRPLGKGAGAVVDRLSVLLADQLPAAVLVDKARNELRELLAGLPELRTPAPGEEYDAGGEA
ncbi:phenylalanine ammonia-lyase [Arthrobacter sp. Soil736]|uniref:aromatic amino acid ammonia-lyase n=1 Tax=Arthrobacter sp. Soil736 TaxID=1736395 RepID=UPI0006FC5F9A|nr:aromatic amino acid ammonia-lyase [Arthrobacter sp. Soil736]KRE66174.1 phenylalanine ammonia-lyase [Arthrobacter sp. Soil736]